MTTLSTPATFLPTFAGFQVFLRGDQKLADNDDVQAYMGGDVQYVLIAPNTMVIFLLNDETFFTFMVNKEFQSDTLQECIDWLNSHGEDVMQEKTTQDVPVEVPTNHNEVVALSYAFNHVLHSWLLKEDIAEINAINAAKKDDTCATHDYCDANQAMIDAFEKGLNKELDLQNPAHIDLVNAAWAMSKEKQFSIA